jgi:exopolysaccharide production protein ExoZ
MKQIANIQILRGLAALAVVAFHAQQAVRWNNLKDPLPDLLSGAFGVDLFFAISGFIMVYSSAAMFGADGAAGVFLRKRIARIAPLYWLITTIYAVYVLHVTRYHQDHTDLLVNFVTSVSFVGYLSPMSEFGFPLYSPGWTLDYEMFFYLCFSTTLMCPRRFAVAALALFFASLVILGQVFELPFFASHLASSQILEFVGGMLVAEIYMAGVRLRASLAAALITVGVFGVFYTAPTMGDWADLRGLVWGSFAVVVLAGASMGTFQSSGAFVRRWFEALGGASYSLYLVHYALIIAFAEVLHHFVNLSSIPGIIYFPLLVASSVAAAFPTYRFIEIPLSRALSRLLSVPHRIRLDGSDTVAAALTVK